MTLVPHQQQQLVLWHDMIIMKPCENLDGFIDEKHEGQSQGNYHCGLNRSYQDHCNGKPQEGNNACLPSVDSDGVSKNSDPRRNDKLPSPQPTFIFVAGLPGDQDCRSTSGGNGVVPYNHLIDDSSLLMMMAPSGAHASQSGSGSRHDTTPHGSVVPCNTSSNINGASALARLCYSGNHAANLSINDRPHQLHQQQHHLSIRRNLNLSCASTGSHNTTLTYHQQDTLITPRQQQFHQNTGKKNPNMPTAAAAIAISAATLTSSSMKENINPLPWLPTPLVKNDRNTQEYDPSSGSNSGSWSSSGSSSLRRRAAPLTSHHHHSSSLTGLSAGSARAVKGNSGSRGCSQHHNYIHQQQRQLFDGAGVGRAPPPHPNRGWGGGLFGLMNSDELQPTFHHQHDHEQLVQASKMTGDETPNNLRKTTSVGLMLEPSVKLFSEIKSEKRLDFS